jgi:molybdate transport system substrate-binding protein
VKTISFKTFAVIVSTTLVLQSHAQQTNKIRIAAASDLKFALDSIAAIFKKNNPGTVDITYGSSGKFFEQLSNGAPFDIFFSADISYPEQLKEKRLVLSEVYPYGVGRIVLWSKKIDPEKEGMNSLLQSSIKKIAIANPAHAPYGKRAEEALSHYQLLETLKEKLVYGENISQTAQFVTTGAADIGIVALSLALSPNMKKENGKYFLIPESSHQPLVQGVVLMRPAEGNKLAEAFLQFVKSETATAILQHFGFTKP